MNNHNELSSIEAELYAKTHTLVRPKLNWLKCIFFLFIVLSSNVSCVVLLRTSVFHLIVIVLCVNLCILMLLLKHICRFIIKCHQRYAPDHIRRRCKCKPSCSEYALLALDKYNIFKALVLIYNRCRYTCRGAYKIDYP